MESLITVLVALALFALLGHGIWLLFAWLLRMLGRLFDPDRPEPLRAMMCPKCGSLWDGQGGLRHCNLCGWPPRRNGDRPSARPELILSYLQRRIERYRELGILPVETCGRILRTIQDEARSSRPEASGPVPMAEPFMVEAQPVEVYPEQASVPRDAS